MTISILFCYADEDEPLLKKLQMQLKPLQRKGLINIWHDRDISAGTEWERAISEQLNTAQIILLLISPDFIASDYCYSTEMKRAIERHKRKEARVIHMVTENGGVETAHLLLAKDPTDGFTKLWEKKRLDLSVEALILKPQFASLFDEVERENARKRLADYGYTAPWDSHKK